MAVVLTNHQEFLAVDRLPFHGNRQPLDPDRIAQERLHQPFMIFADRLDCLLADLRSDFKLVLFFDNCLGFGSLPRRDDPLFNEMSDLHLRSGRPGLPYASSFPRRWPGSCPRSPR